jgi:hypothetical protein
MMTLACWPVRRCWRSSTRAGSVALAQRHRGVIARDIAEALGEASLLPAVDEGLFQLF